MKALSSVKVSRKIASLGLALIISAGFNGALSVGNAQAEATFSVYGGHNSSPHSKVEYDLNLGAGQQNATVGWDGKSFEMRPYYGVRATWWLDSNPEFGLAIDLPMRKFTPNRFLPGWIFSSLPMALIC